MRVRVADHNFPAEKVLMSPNNAEHLELFLDTLYLEQGVSENTLAAYRSDLEKFCQFLKDKVRDDCSIVDKNIVIFNPFVLNRQKENDNVNDENFDFVFFSKIQLRKGILWLLRELKKRWDSGSKETLVIYGGDTMYDTKNQMMSEYIGKKYSDYIDQGLITIKGLQPFEDIQRIMQNARIVFNPTLFENFPYVTLETLSLGCITLSSKSGGQREVIKDGVNGFLFDIKQPETFHNAINYILQLSKNKQDNIRNEARKTINRRKFFNEIYDKKIKFLREVVNSDESSKYPILKYIHEIQKESNIFEDIKFQNDLLSIVIPYYNMGSYIEETLESIANINYKNVETIVVDDGSDKNNRAILKKLLEKYDFRIEAKANGGLSSARNYGAQKANGEFIAFLDSDDCVTKVYYERAINIFKKYQNISFVGSFAKYFGDSSSNWVSWDPEFPYVLIHNMLNAGLVYRKKDFLCGGLNDEDMEYGMEDYESLISMMDHGYYGITIPDFDYLYRVSNCSMSREFNYTNKQYLYELIVLKHKNLFKCHASDIVGILNSNGPGYMYDNPTQKTFIYNDVVKPPQKTKSRIGDLFFRSIRSPYKLLTFPLNFMVIILGVQLHSKRDILRLIIKAKKKVFPRKWI